MLARRQPLQPPEHPRSRSPACSCLAQLGSAAPWEVLLAKSSVELLRSPRIAIRQTTVVDTPPTLNQRSSPLVLGELFVPEQGQIEYTRGMLHPAVDPQM